MATTIIWISNSETNTIIRKSLTHVNHHKNNCNEEFFNSFELFA